MFDRSMPRLLLMTVAAAAWLSAGALTVPGTSRAEVRPSAAAKPRDVIQIAVSGQGKVQAVPDVLVLRGGVEARRATAAEAMQVASETMGRFQAVLTKGGVAAKDIKTAAVSLNPEFDYSGKRPRITGYVAANTVEARFRDFARAGEILAKATQAAGDEARINGLAFEVEDLHQYVIAARSKAFAEAKAIAAQYAELAGRTLGDVMAISESTSGMAPPPVRYFDKAMPAMAAEAGPAPIPVNPGEQEVTVSVNVAFELI